MNKSNALISIIEGKWNHDVVGKEGSISRFNDSGDNISFEFNSKKDKWFYKKNLADYVPMDDKTSDEYANASDSGNIRIMTKIAKQLLG